MTRLRKLAVVAVILLAGCTGISSVDDTTPNTDRGSLTTEQDPPNTARESLNTTQVEATVHEYINEERSQRGLSTVHMDAELATIARNHSTDMATDGYFAHESPEGNNFADRYANHGYDCEVPISGNRYSTGAENIAYTYANTDIRADNGETINHHGDESEIARGLVNQWMNSTGHREIILSDYWQNEGVGVAVTENDGQTKVLATQNFC